MGTVAPNCKLSFQYRVVDYIGNTGVKHYMDPGDEIVVYVVDSISATQVYRIDKTNHTDTSFFKEIEIDMANFLNRTVKVRFSVMRGASSSFDFNVNFDNVGLYTVPVTTTVSNRNIEKMRLFPNPSNEKAQWQFSLKKESNMRFSIIDIHGKEVFLSPQTHFSAGENTIAIPSETLQNGIYFCRLMSDEGLVSEKLIISK
jgi:hypothetical protein